MFALISLGVAIKNPVSNISKNFLDMREKKIVLAYCSPKILFLFIQSVFYLVDFFAPLHEKNHLQINLSLEFQSNLEINYPFAETYPYNKT